MTQYRIPFNVPTFLGQELAYVSDCLASGRISGDGEYSKRCQAFLEERHGIPKALLTTSCTHALEMAALLLDIKPGDEVIVPSFTFVSSVNAFVLRGAKPVFADIRPDTLNLDERQLSGLINEKTRAIVLVHYAGVACEMDAIMDIARERNIAVVEDNAHGLFARYKGRCLGAFGELATLSFHETKNFTCGEGGALLITDPGLIERAEIIREKGTNRSRFFRGQVDKYTWVDLGSSYLPSDMLAAFLLAQFEQAAAIQSRREEIWRRYQRGLSAWAASNNVALPEVPAHVDQAFHMYYMLLPSMKARAALIQHLKRRGILSVFHYQPLHLSTMGQRYGGRPGDCPITENLADRLLRLPFYYALSPDDQDDVIAALHAFKEWQ